MPRKIKRRANYQRPIQFPLFTNAIEREFISREAFAMREKLGPDFSQNDLIVRRTTKGLTPAKLLERLEELRAAQAGVKDKSIWTPRGQNGRVA